MIIKTKPITSIKNAFSVEGYNVVVTGGNRGIGYGISYAYAEAGANVAILCRNIESGNQAVESLKQFGGRYCAIQCDISSLESVEAAAVKVYEFFDYVDVLVNNAGVATTTKFMEDTALSEWTRVINTNLHGPANCIHAIVPKMMEAGRGGSIINISSIGGQSTGSARTHFNPPYHASKAGLDHFTHYLAVELGDYGIRVNGIAPGSIMFEGTRKLFYANPETANAIISHFPIGVPGEPEDIAAATCYLASEDAKFVVGAIMTIDGGWICGYNRDL